MNLKVKPKLLQRRFLKEQNLKFIAELMAISYKLSMDNITHICVRVLFLCVFVCCLCTNVERLAFISLVKYLNRFH